MERKFNITWAVIFGLITLASLYAAIFKGVTHDYGLAVLMAGMAWVCIYEARHCKQKDIN